MHSSFKHLLLDNILLALSLLANCSLLCCTACFKVYVHIEFVMPKCVRQYLPRACETCNRKPLHLDSMALCAQYYILLSTECTILYFTKYCITLCTIGSSKPVTKNNHFLRSVAVQILPILNQLPYLTWEYVRYLTSCFFL